jgi:hypothetical protein
MAEADKRPVTLEDTSRLKSHPEGRSGEAADEKGLITLHGRCCSRRRIYAEDFGGTGDVSEATDSSSTVS